MNDTNQVDAAAPSVQQKKDIVAKWLGTGSINLFGRPYSGKDTQCALLAKWLDAPVIGGGDILRNRTGIPAHVRKIIDAGKLAPTNDYLNIVTPYLSKAEFAGRPLVLSSVGRWHGEEQGILKAAAAAGHPVKAVIFLKLNEDAVHQRWHIAQELAHRGERADDASHLLDVRLDEFRNKTLPVLDFYRQQGLLVEVDGHKPIEAVQTEILDKLYELATSA
jgi:adenylate kinase